MVGRSAVPVRVVADGALGGLGRLPRDKVDAPPPSGPSSKTFLLVAQTEQDEGRLAGESGLRWGTEVWVRLEGGRLENLGLNGAVPVDSFRASGHALLLPLPQQAPVLLI